MVAKIKITGLRELQASLRQANKDLPKGLRIALNLASAEVIDYAEPRFPKLTGRAAGSLKARSSQREARVALGGNRAPYAPWLDFGGEGRRKGRPPARPFLTAGRYVYRGVAERHDRITEIMAKALADVARGAGLTVE
jgi:phage gpG-like protein